jgi:hypothetical protein
LYKILRIFFLAVESKKKEKKEKEKKEKEKKEA